MKWLYLFFIIIIVAVSEYCIIKYHNKISYLDIYLIGVVVGTISEFIILMWCI